MQTKTLPESQNHGDWRESKSRRPFFRSLLGEIVYRRQPGSSAARLGKHFDLRSVMKLSLIARTPS